MVRIAINGFGRIGRMIARIALHRSEIELVAVNDLVPADNLAYLFQYDTVHGRYPKKVTAVSSEILVEGHRIRVFGEKDPEQLPWRELGVDYVVESTGRFTHKDDAAKHLQAGAKR